MDDINGKVKVHTDSNHLTSYVQVSAPSEGGLACTVEDVEMVLKKHNIVFGLVKNAIVEAVKQENWGKELVVARGIAPVDGQNAVLFYKVEISKGSAVPVVDEKGQVDYRDLGIINNVSKGQLLVERKAPTEGKKGTDVFGRELKPRPGKDIALPRGKNTVVSEDEMNLYAAIDGHVRIAERKLTVNPVFELNGDVDYSSGNIDFNGSVVIIGNIASGFKVRAGGDIEVHGFIEGAEIVAGGSLHVKGGIKSGLKGIIRAGENITARFVENSRLEAGKDIIIREAIMQSHIRAGGNVRVNDRRAIIVGGIVQAFEEVECKILGSQLATQTVIEVGINPYHREEYQCLLNERKAKKKIYEDLGHNLQLIQKSGIAPQDLPESKRRTLIKMLDEYKSVRKEITAAEERIEVLEEEFERVKWATVKAHELVCPGVKISIGNSYYIVNDQIKYAQFILEEGEIKLTSLS